MTAMLEEGAGSRSSLEISDAIDFLGADLGAGSSFDSSAVRLHVPVARLADALPIMADVALRPTFPAEELERLRQQRLTALLQARDDPGTIAAQALPRVLYGPTHRYGTGTAGTAETIGAITVADLRTQYAALFRPANSALVVVGDIVPDRVMPLLEAQFGSWQIGGAGGRRGASRGGPAGEARGLDRRQARRAANPDPHRLDRRGAVDARLLSDSGHEHDSRRLVHVPSQHEPAREARLRLRRHVRVRHARDRRARSPRPRASRRTRPRRR